MQTIARIIGNSRLKRLVCQFLMLVVPARRQFLVYGYPDYEENSLALAVQLSALSHWPVKLLCANEADARRYLRMVAEALKEPGAGEAVEVVRRTRLRDLYEFVTSSCVIYTHGLFDSPRALRGRIHINLWHGTGAKRTRNQNQPQFVGAKHFVGCNSRWSYETMMDLGMPVDSEILVGNPRQDLFDTEPNSEWKAKLGIGNNPFIVWMPTYRVSRGTVAGVLEDGTAIANSAERLHWLIKSVVELAGSTGVQVIVKPHPLDAEEWGGFGVKVLTTPQILDAGLLLHQFLGQSSGMISDYSSAWVDYLHTGKPVCLLCHDIDSYVESRGLKEPSMVSFAGAHIVNDADGIEAFICAVSENATAPTDWTVDLREAIGYFENVNRSVILARQCAELVGAMKAPS